MYIGVYLGIIGYYFEELGPGSYRDGIRIAFFCQSVTGVCLCFPVVNGSLRHKGRMGL
jgi:hypothetical protein